ncbi:MAG: 6-phospho-beta-glucosidase, partial [Thermotogota bacterium]
MKKITVIGGGSTYTPELMDGLIKHAGDIDLGEVYLLDIDETDKFKIVAELGARMVEHAEGGFKVRWGTDVEDGLKDADFVLQQYRPGLLEGRINDETIPLKYNLIGQETTGVGGFSCALRALPMVAKYVESVRKWAAPDAFIINFTNPSGLISEFVINTLGFERYAGLCNIPINTLQTFADTFNCQRKDVFLHYYGLNHMSWIDKVFINGKDRTQEAFTKTYKPENVPDSELFEKFAIECGMVLNPYLRYYYTTPTMLAEEKEAKATKGTRGEQVKKIENELLEKYSDVGLYEKPPELEQRGGSMYSTAAVELIRDLSTPGTKEHIVNIRNNGAVENLDRNYVLEINGRVSEKMIRPVGIEKAHPMAKGLIDTIKSFERLTIEAHLNNSRKKARE